MQLRFSLNDADPNPSTLSATGVPAGVSSCVTTTNPVGIPLSVCEWAYPGGEASVSVTYTVQVSSQAADEVW